MPHRRWRGGPVYGADPNSNTTVSIAPTITAATQRVINVGGQVLASSSSIRFSPGNRFGHVYKRDAIVKALTRILDHDRKKPMTNFAAGLMRCIGVSLWLAVLPLSPVVDAAEFYKDRTITFIIGSAPGGGYDTYSRLVASHLGRQIGGHPTIVPQNVPGAGSIRAANYLYNVAPKDGTTIGMVDEAIFLNQILGVQEPTTDAAKLSWFGGVLRRIMGTQETKTDA